MPMQLLWAEMPFHPWNLFLFHSIDSLCKTISRDWKLRKLAESRKRSTTLAPKHSHCALASHNISGPIPRLETDKWPWGATEPQPGHESWYSQPLISPALKLYNLPRQQIFALWLSCARLGGKKCFILHFCTYKSTGTFSKDFFSQGAVK